jgi:hypothetical protein
VFFEVVATVLLFLNLADAAFTIAWTTAGFADEANPLMLSVLAHSPTLFMAAKLALVSLGIYLLSRLRRQPVAVAAVTACGCVYAILFVYHLSELPRIL